MNNREYQVQGSFTNFISIYTNYGQITVTVINNSTYAATNIGVEDVLPSGYAFVSVTATNGDYSETTATWDIPSIAIGATASLEMTVNVRMLMTILM